MFQEMKRIHGFCPCCSGIFRLSDIQIFTKGAPPQTPFDRSAAERAKLDASIARFDEREDRVRESARALGQAAARRRLRKIAGAFAARRVDPQDVKILFDPVDYVAFRGLNGNGVSAVEFIDRPAATRQREKVQRSLASALRKGNVEWRLLRIGGDGVVAQDE
ncbi:MAG: hypothetical protein IT460_01665 [Planctomycetes bacterium]|nr:hypothetical protein [Planctomycetota bacterium]